MSSARVSALVRGESEESFEELALAVFRARYEGSEFYRRRCEERGATPDRVTDWRQVPALALDAGASGPHTAAAALRHLVIERGAILACLSGMDRPAVLSLLPPAGGEEASPDAELADHLLRRGAPQSLVAAGTRGVEVIQARSFLAARQRDGRPTLVLGTGAALHQLVDGLDRRGLRFRLPPASRVIETGARSAGDPELPERLGSALALPAESLVRLYRGAGSPTLFRAGHDRQGAPTPFRAPPWARARVVDPATATELPPGSAGTLAIYDLAACGEAPHLLTSDGAIADEAGFHLVGEIPPATA